MLKARRSDRPPATKKRINKKNNTIKNSYNLKLGFIKKYIIYIFLSLIILFINSFFCCWRSIRSPSLKHT
jgi:hypothetical protein